MVVCARCCCQVVVDQDVLTRASAELTMPEASAIADKTLQHTVRGAGGRERGGREGEGEAAASGNNPQRQHVRQYGLPFKASAKKIAIQTSSGKRR